MIGNFLVVRCLVVVEDFVVEGSFTTVGNFETKDLDRISADFE